MVEAALDKDAMSGSANALETATFAAGCFWGVEAEFRKVRGVADVAVGFMGGHVPSPSYEQVCEGNTGHAEAVEVRYDLGVVAYDELLQAFWNMHDPTTLDQQGPDIGSQYHSVIFYHTPEQEAAAKESKTALEQSQKYSRPIVTVIVPATKFYRAEEYHQRYFEKHGR